MLPQYDDLLIKRFEIPDEVRVFEKGKFELLNIGGMTIGRASYEPGWKWSVHVRPVVNTPSRQVEHIGMVVSGLTFRFISWARMNMHTNRSLRAFLY